MEDVKLEKTAYDPKNREVLFMSGVRGPQKQKVYQVEKPATLYVSPVTNSLKIAVEFFEQQINCSQN